MSLGRRTRIRVSLDDRPGELNTFLKTIGEELANIITIQQDRYREGLSMYHLGVSVVVETLDQAHKDRLIHKLKESGYEIQYTN